MTRHLLIGIYFLLACGTCTFAAAPKVVITSPDNGEIDVDPSVKEIRIEFDQPMHPGGRSVVGGGDAFRKISGELKWSDEKTFVIPVTLEPEHEYYFSINSDTFKGFANKKHEPAEWYSVHFKTRVAGAAPAANDVTPAQNKAAVDSLKKAIDDAYAYRDRKKIDWQKEIESRRKNFENAKSSNEFARLTAHLLRLAEDAHVSVVCGEMQISTRSNSAPPNVNRQLLQKIIPGWNEYRSGLAAGKLEGNIGYILFSSCSEDQSRDFDKALGSLKNTKALIIDARSNGGGDENAAMKVAGRFVAKSAVYSKDRLREHGKWNGPFDRVVEARNDADRYTKPVVVLIGPKIASSAESFVLMMKHGANAKLIGEPTRGSSGRPLAHQLGNRVIVYLSSWEDQQPDGRLIEGEGVKPDIVVQTNLRELQNSDPVLDAAVKALSE